MGFRYHFVLNLLFVVCLSGLVGCASQKTVALPVDAPDAFSQTGSEVLPEQWWTVFGDDQLNGLVDSALVSNFDLKTAWMRLQAAKAVVRREGADLWPEIEGNIQSDATRTQGGASRDVSFEAGVSASYEVDLWGRVRASVDAEQFRVQASAADYQATALSLSAQITQTWYNLVVTRRQRALLDSQVTTNENVLHLLENRFRIGQIQNVDLIRQKQLLASTREQRILTDSRLQVLAHQLAVLLGRSPQDSTLFQSDYLPQLPPLPETGVPLELVRRRPDVFSAFLNVQAADRDYAAAMRNRFPRLSLSASASSSADQAGDLFKNWASSFAGNLLVPIFYGGRLQAEANRTDAVKEQRVYEYAQTVLTAFREVEDALVQESRQRERLATIVEQVRLARQAYEYLQVQYFNGARSYLDVLTALDDVQQLRRNLLDAELTLMTYRIGLYRAIAGSFAMPQLRVDGETDL